MSASTTPKPLQIAPFKKRLIGFGFDYLIISAYIIFLILVTLGLFSILGVSPGDSSLFENPIIADLISFLTLILPVILYFTFLESSSTRATWGKRKAGVQVTNQSGGRLTKGQALIRSLIKFLPWQIAHTSLFHIEGWPMAPEDPSLAVTIGLIAVWVLVGIYFSMMVATKDGRTLYDWASGSVVVMNR
ncbi:MAG: RDD family protein [Anaerolineae bacterium]